MKTSAIDRRSTTMSAAADLRIYALLPFRGLVNAKSRLASALSEAERRQLALALLNRAVAAVADAGVERIAVVTRDPLLAASGLDPRAEVLLQDNEGLNAAVRQGQRWALSGGAGGLLILLPDLPTLDVADIRAIIDAAAPDAAVLAPDRHGTGTNALLLAPPDGIAPAFGVGSAARHRRSLALADIPITDVERRGTHLDLDTPDDIRALENARRAADHAPGASRSAPKVNHHSSGV
ncbi:MAG TPA: 2-phospho-L-lactate guanylyltransferase [Thermomicrobiales bacterium]|jgi:2-phospho-L-lactate guanylyltransferase|nr:2-phospho-L-lactate guanylyltransferase [Chloroflexota bacterium]HBY46083.1 2-phospho-L-lactate guanylyltransferase [Chloroflexota bacterium]HCG28421.1 2-phospho-L-lactate guanylyltransferase [Chloroflexota bacterium]HQZ90046.1 2-phospho-L-lactate guanylyltransferase [Thermomicrobiales bacterium]